MSQFQVSPGRGVAALACGAFTVGLAAVLLVWAPGVARATIVGGSGSAARTSRVTARPSAADRYQGGIVLVDFRPGVSRARARRLERSVGAKELRPLIFTGSRTRAERALARRLGASYVLRVPSGTVLTAVHSLAAQRRSVRYAEPNYEFGPSAPPAGARRNAVGPNAASAGGTNPSPIVPTCTGGSPAPSGSVVPNDPGFGCQWGSLNTGQTVSGSSGTITGTPGADDHVTQAWKVTTGDPSIVIGELDSGVDYTHPDLAANIWTNPGGIGGCPAGTHGFNVDPYSTAGACNPLDDNSAPPTSYGGHGTHVAGIMGAVGDNGMGVAGVNWHTTILPVKAVNSSLDSSALTLVDGINKFVAAAQAGVNIKIVNYSPVQNATASDPNLPELKAAIQTLGANGILFVTAAGGARDPSGDPSSGVSDDTTPHYPCNFSTQVNNEICVGGSDQHDRIADWSNYGSVVDMVAPGDNVLSTLIGTNPGSATNDVGQYGYISGVSMAAPQVSGAAALILSVQPSMSMTALRRDLVTNVDPLTPSANGATVGAGGTGGRLDICNALPGCSSLINTTTAVQCTPTSVTVGQGSACTATVADTNPAITVAPTGTVTFSTDSAGTFTPTASCTLSPGAGGSSSCAVTYSPTAVGSGTHGLSGAYGGDASHATSAGTAALTVTAGASTGGGGATGSPGGGGTGGGGTGGTNGAGTGGGGTGGTGGGGTTGTGTGGTGTGGPGGSRGALPAAPVNIGGPTIHGSARLGRVLTCSTGSWANSPTGFTYRWTRDHTVIPGADSAHYRVQVLDESTRVECTVTARNSSGSRAQAATGTGRSVAIPGTLNCPRAAGRLRGRQLGRLALGMTRTRARARLPRFVERHHAWVDRFCLYGGAGIQVGYAPPKLLGGLDHRQRDALSGRIVVTMTGNLHYAIRGVRPGSTLTAARRHLKKLSPTRRVGGDLWYVAPDGSTSIVLEVRGGVVQQIGIADRALTRTRSAQMTLLRTFELAPSRATKPARLVVPRGPLSARSG